MKKYAFPLFILLFSLMNVSASDKLHKEETTYPKFEDVSNQVLYVDADAALGGDGMSWATAYKYLQDGIADAASNSNITEIWVADGEYYPDEDESGNVTDNDRAATFQLQNNLSILGGFSGTETASDQRDHEANTTTLSGDINQDLVLTGNSYIILIGSNTDNTAVIDGFVITAANNDNSGLGGGMYNFSGSPTITNVTFSRNIVKLSGGGMYNDHSSPLLNNVIFWDNSLLNSDVSGILPSFGGGMYNAQSSPILTNIFFISNRGGFGGGVYNYQSSPVITQVVFSANEADFSGGGIFNDESSPTITNATFCYGIDFGIFNNSGGSGGSGGIYNQNGSDVTIQNCLFYENTKPSIINENSSPIISYSYFDDNTIAGGSINDGGNLLGQADPFVNIDERIFQLLPISNYNFNLKVGNNAIDAGNNDANNTATDIAGNVRKVDDENVADTGNGVGAIIDMGAYEKQDNSTPIIYVDRDKPTGGNGLSWGAAFTYLQDALYLAQSNSFYEEIWVAEGVYYPDDAENSAANIVANATDEHFYLITGVSILGGFVGTEVSTDVRDPATNLTILSGDIDHEDPTTEDQNKVNGIVTKTADIRGENSNNVVDGSNTNATAILDGFTITAGQATKIGVPGFGGGLLMSPGSPTLNQLRFIGNLAERGGAIFSFSSSIDLSSITNTIFLENTATIEGGAIYSGSSSFQTFFMLKNVVFSGNTAINGGAMYSTTNDQLINVSFSNNSATNRGGGLFASGNGSSSDIHNSIFVGNTASNGNSIFNNNTNLDIFYSYFDDAPAEAVDNGGNAINNNLVNQADPFVDADGADDIAGTEDDNLQLVDNSTAIDAGDNSQNNTTKDAAGNPRFFDDPNVTDTGAGTAPIIDMGAFEKLVLLPSHIRVVDVDAALGGDGTSWTTAYKYLQDALTAAQADNTITEIWVADGVYYPDEDEGGNVTDNATEATFQLQNDLSILGGFAGMETANTQRDFATNRTILSGDIDQNDIKTNDIVMNTDNIIGSNSRKVVNGTNINNTAVLDGFTITAGQAIYNGGGMFLQSSSPILINLQFIGNKANAAGGGLFLEFDDNSNPMLNNVVFYGNESKLGGGLAIYCITCNPILSNITFVNNTATNQGGAILNNITNDLKIYNSIFFGNTAPISNSIHNENICPLVNCGPPVYPIIKNSYFDDASLPANSNASSSDNLFAQPDPFVDLVNGDLQLKNLSTAIDAGDNSFNTTIIDLANNPRKIDDTGKPDTGSGITPIIDMGAFERQSNSIPFFPVPSNVLAVDADAYLGGDGRSWDLAFKFLQDALAAAAADNTITEIWVTDGVYYPDEDEAGNVTNNNESATFVLKNNLSILGGFASGESINTQRDPISNISILSGDIDQNDTKTNDIVTDPNNITGSNSTHVVTASNLNNSALLDGFTITAGNADGNSTATGSGGGLYSDSGSASLKRLRFIGNKAVDQGGAMFLGGSSSNLENLSFYKNTSDEGGAIYAGAKGFTLSNAIFSGNSATGTSGGGAVFLESASPTFNNITFVNNTAPNGAGGAMRNTSNSDPKINNSIFVANNAASSSVIANIGSPNGSSQPEHRFNYSDSNLPGINLGNNLTSQVDPFADIDGADNIPGTIDDDLQLINFSGAIDSGDNNLNATTEDEAGNSRNIDDAGVADTGSGTTPIIDRGALEKQTESQSILFVDADADLGGDGLSWGRAFRYLQDALALATTGDEIWVADGVYYPDDDEAGNVTNDNESASFQLLNGVSILGGFNGTESTSTARDRTTNISILSGDITQNDTNTDGNNIAEQTAHIIGDNSFNVVIGSNTDATAILDGFTITAGQADGANGSDRQGAGMYISAGSPSLKQLTFIANFAASDGGGMYNESSSNPILLNVVFLGNEAGDTGGGMVNLLSSSTLTNVSFSSNTASNFGGGMFNFSGASLSLSNVTFYGNTATNGGGITNFNASPNIRNSIFHGNIASSSDNSIHNLNNSTPFITYSYFDDTSLPSGSTDGGNNLLGQANPFVDATNDNLQLVDLSPAIDAGNNSLNTSSEDLAGNARFKDDVNVTDSGSESTPIIDMGAFERQTNSCEDDDNDGVCNNADQCPGFDDTADSDGDTVPDGCDICEGVDDTIGSGQTTKTWTGAVNDDWANPCNWSPIGVPTSSDPVEIKDADIIIYTNTNAEANGIKIQDNAELIIRNGASLSLNDRGIEMIQTSGFSPFPLSPSLTNFGTINYGQNGNTPSGFTAISSNGDDVDAFIDNRSSGIINIDNCSVGINLRSATGSLENDGKIYIGQNGGASSITNFAFDFEQDNEIVNNGSFFIWDNFRLPESFLVPGSFYNEGLFTVNTAQNHSNQGSLENDGVVVAVQGGLDGIINNDLLISPIAGGCEIEDAIQIGNSNNFTASNEWFYDSERTDKAGDYDRTSNTFSLTQFQATVSTLYLTARSGSTIYDATIEVTINNYPDVMPPTNVTYCSGAITTEINFSGTSMNTLFSWMNSNTQIGLGASGTGNIASFTATNATSSPISAIITVTPYSVGLNGVDDGGTGDDCIGMTQTFTITVFNNAACANACTTNDLTLDETSTEEGIIQALETITSNRIIADNTEVIFKAGTSITLEAGFHAEAGSSFTAQIEACPATLIASEASNRTATSSNTITQPKVKVFPNPVRAYTNISINLPEEQTVQLDIYDLNGRKITTIVPPTPLFAGTHTFEWSCDQVEAGIYFVVMNGQQVGRLAIID